MTRTTTRKTQAVADFDISVQVGEHGVATFHWHGAVAADALAHAVSVAADDALIARGLRRIEVSVPSTDRVARRALLRAGFRVEGVRRQAILLDDGTPTDVTQFARLTADQVHGPNGFSGVMNSALPKKRLIAHVLIRHADGRVLLCDTQFKQDWELPGGIVEPGEAPRLGAMREVREELGIHLPINRLLVADWMPPYLGWDDAIEMIFDGGTVTQADVDNFTLQENEIKRVELVDLDAAAELLTPLGHRRLVIAASLAPGETAYLEDGRRTD